MIELTIDERNSIEQLYNDNKDLISSVYLSGSRLLGWIAHPHDVDVLVFVKDYASWKKLKTICPEYKAKAKDFKVQFIINSDVESLRMLKDKYKDLQIVLSNKIYYCNGTPDLFTKDILPIDYERCYIRNGLLFGENIDDLLYWDMLQIDEKQVKSALNSSVMKQTEDCKQWYHLYTIKCILENKNYNTFTEEQIENINILHDKAEDTLEKRRELINECVEFFSEKEN